MGIGDHVEWAFEGSTRVGRIVAKDDDPDDPYGPQFLVNWDDGSGTDWNWGHDLRVVSD